MEYMRLINEALGGSLISPKGLEDGQGKLQGQPLHVPRVSGCNRSTSGMQGRKAACMTLCKLPSYHKINGLRTFTYYFHFLQNILQHAQACSSFYCAVTLFAH